MLEKEGQVDTSARSQTIVRLAMFEGSKGNRVTTVEETGDNVKRDGQKQNMSAILGHYKKFGFYFKCTRKPCRVLNIEMN